MIKRVFFCVLCALITVSFLGCNEEASKDTSTTEYVSSSTTVTSNESSQNEESDFSSVVSISEDSFVDVGGTDLYIPDGFTEELAYGYYIYSKDFGSDKIYFAFHNHAWYSLDTDTDSYDLEDVPDIEADRFVDSVNEVMDHYKDKSVITLDSETSETINDLSFLKQKGTMHIEFREPEDTHELKYVSLYTLYDNNYYKKVPTSIILFSDCYDAETEAEMERLAEEIVTTTEWVLEY